MFCLTPLPIIYRDEFQKLGDDLEHAKARDTDRYYDLLGQLKESFRRCEPVCSILLHSMDAVFCIIVAESWTNHV